MSNITQGMNVDEVEALGRLLQSKADQLRSLMTDIESTVGRTVWAGPDAQRFTQQWWPEHKTRLQTVAEQVHGFGQSAMNNASEQRQASGVSVAGVGIAAGVGAAAVGVASPGAGPAAPVTGGGLPSWGQPISDTQAREIANRYIPRSERVDYSGEGLDADKWYQCTIWAKARWRQMGYDGPNWHGDGGAVAGHINTALGKADSHVPTVGAIVSSPGHVAVVEEVRTLPNGQLQYRASEMNSRVSDSNAPGASSDDVAYADEFRITGWVTPKPGYIFAPFPG